MKFSMIQCVQINDRGAPCGAEIDGESSPLLPDPGHAGVGSRPYLYLEFTNRLSYKRTADFLVSIALLFGKKLSDEV